VTWQIPTAQRQRAFHLGRVWGSRHGGSLYSQALVRELASNGWLVTVLAERFEEPFPNGIVLPSFFRRSPRYWLGKMLDTLKLCHLTAHIPGSLVIVQGDLPRLTYLLLQCLVPLLFIRQDGILTCPANHRFLPESRTVCRRQAGPGCLLVHRHEHCFGKVPLPRRIGRVVFRLRDRLLLSCLRNFVCNSFYIARAHRRSATVLYPPPTSAAATNRFPHPPPARDLHRLVFCGRLEPVKGAADAITILTVLPGSYHLEILGEGPELPRLISQAGRLQLGDRVRFHGWVNPTERDEWLASAGALLIPSRWDEAFGMAGLEALAQGTPVVAYDVGGISEWCRDGAGILVSCGDVTRAAAAVRQLTADPVRWSVSSENAKRVADMEFPPERFSRDVGRLLRDWAS